MNTKLLRYSSRKNPTLKTQSSDFSTRSRRPSRSSFICLYDLTSLSLTRSCTCLNA